VVVITDSHMPPEWKDLLKENVIIMRIQQ
jgi:hypothetical protein